MSSSIYLDYAAATPLDPEVLAVMQPYLIERFANPSSLHQLGRMQRAALETARKQLSATLGAKPAEIIFTSGSTEATNLAIQGVARAHPGSRLVASAIEHEAVLAVVRGLAPAGHTHALVAVESSGVVDAVRVAEAIDDATVLVCVQYANNEIGTVQPIKKIAAVVEAVRTDRHQRGVRLPLYLYCDAAQAGLLSLQVARLGVDLMSLGGSKLYGPAGSGLLYVRSGVVVSSPWFGGGQEQGLRSGTESVAAAAGLAAALSKMQAERAAESGRQCQLRDELWKQVQQIPGTRLNGALRGRLPGNLNVSFDGVDGEALVAYLDAAGIAAATGSACTAANEEPSHVLLALGRTAAEAASSLRLSLGRPTTAEETRRCAAMLAPAVARLRAIAR